MLELLTPGALRNALTLDNDRYEAALRFSWMELPLKLELDTLSSLLLRKVVSFHIRKAHLREHEVFQSSNLKLFIVLFLLFWTWMIFERNRNRKEIRIIVCSLLKKFLMKSSFVQMTRCKRLKNCVVFGIGPENSSSSRRVRPFVKIPNVEVGTEIVQVKVDLPWGVSTVDYADYIAFLALRLRFD